MELLTSLKAQSELDTYIIVQYSLVQYSLVQYSLVQHSLVQYSLVQYSLVQYITDRKVGKQTDRKADNILM